MKNSIKLLKFITLLFTFLVLGVSCSLMPGYKDNDKNKDRDLLTLAAAYLFLTSQNSEPSPTVTLTSPLAGVIANNIPLNTKISATFSETMDETSINGNSFTLQQGTTQVEGTVTYSGKSAIFSPSGNMNALTNYTATITTSARNLNGNSINANFVWTFRTGSTVDNTAPVVSLVLPINTASSVSLNSKITAQFSEAMNPSTIIDSTFSLKVGGNAVLGIVSSIGSHLVFSPNDNLIANSTYTGTITTSAKDLAGNALAADYIWTFTTGSSADSTPPTITTIDPLNVATNVMLRKRVTVTFSEVMDPTTLTTANFRLSDGNTNLQGIVSYAGLVATFIPLNALKANTVYRAFVSNSVSDLTGNKIGSEKVWAFTTLPTKPDGPNAVDLGPAKNFVILAKSGISTEAGTSITGDLGLSPAAATFITGFGLIMDSTNVFSTSSLVTGKIYAANYTPPTPANMTSSVSAMELAYTDAAGRVSDTDPNGYKSFVNLGAGDISALTLVPGLYTWSTGLGIDNRGVTLNGGANDVWIFQVAQNLTVANTAIISLAGGAQSKNVFWQVSGSTIIGTTVQFRGIALCQTAITVDTDASVNGRLLSQTAVTLDRNSVTAPAE